MKFLLFFGLLALTEACYLENGEAAATKNCTQPGPFCESCISLVSCIQEDNEWIKTPLQTCRSPEKCVNGQCTQDPDPCCDGTADLTFPCTAEGIFPHPFYFNKFVLCVSEEGRLKSFVSECQEGFDFNIETDLCDTPSQGGVCEKYPIPSCEKIGQSDAIPQKPAMYYLCEQYSSSKSVLYPYLYLCQGGEVYEDYVCKKKTEPTTITTTSVSSTTETPTTPSSTTETPTTETPTTPSSTTETPTTPSSTTKTPTTPPSTTETPTTETPTTPSSTTETPTTPPSTTETPTTETPTTPSSTTETPTTPSSTTETPTTPLSTTETPTTP